MKGVLESEPRKGTETYTDIHLFTEILQFLESEPREGTETVDNHNYSDIQRKFLESEPRKGTETMTIAGKPPFPAPF